MRRSRSAPASTPSQSSGPGNFLFYNRKLFAEANLRAATRELGHGVEFRRVPRRRTALTKRDGAGKVTQWGFVDTWVPYYSAGLFGMNNGTPWCQAANQPDTSELRRRCLHRRRAVLCGPGRQTPGGPHRLPMCSRSRRWTCSRRGRPRWRSADIGATRPSRVPTAWISTSPRCPSGRTATVGTPNIGTTGLAIAATRSAQATGLGVREVRRRAGGTGR